MYEVNRGAIGSANANTSNRVIDSLVSKLGEVASVGDDNCVQDSGPYTPWSRCIDGSQSERVKMVKSIKRAMRRLNDVKQGLVAAGGV